MRRSCVHASVYSMTSYGQLRPQLRWW